MKTTIRAIGNSQGITIPKPLLAELGVSLGDPVDVSFKDQALLVTKAATEYDLNTLVAQCDLEAPEPPDIHCWRTSAPVGNEA
ncbi:AbrB/MazE/SpoVT family DNA-binding domain-containing protein [Pseudomonas nitroreducens]|uniref:AbrB/MazE/SpoVT family DNA-binding domain-containing protein n=1 Tax=Pseudomonas nitroreducens TaxID=46680 RepID=UPI00265AE7AD|nr:AbrB/MazE/SpoVT family DNA-binding domain-containing protein [Pseudomonas nitroreducens]MCP1652301.1 antitoxin ChpS [Pseudomonas nitroreducens]MCP1689811.1 antitoxin ChpS [Pseudomonas nitroreducens]